MLLKCYGYRSGKMQLRQQTHTAHTPVAHQTPNKYCRSKHQTTHWQYHVLACRFQIFAFSLLAMPWRARCKCKILSTNARKTYSTHPIKHTTNAAETNSKRLTTASCIGLSLSDFAFSLLFMPWRLDANAKHSQQTHAKQTTSHNPQHSHWHAHTHTPSHNH